MIIPIKNASLVNGQLNPLIDRIKDLPYAKEEYLKNIRNYLFHEDTVLLIDVDDAGKVTSFAYVEAGVVLGVKEALIKIAFFDPTIENVGKEMADYIAKWSKLKGCKRVSAFVKDKRDNAFIKKYGFDTRFAYISKEL